MGIKVKENYLISGFLVFFILAASQSGFSSLSFQNFVYRDAGQDAWISVLLHGLSLHLIVWMIYKMLTNPSKDVIEINRMVFGKVIGITVSLLMVPYFFLLALAGLRAYIDVVQTWVFPDMNTWELAAIMIGITYYLVSGGFRVLAGISLFSIIIGILLLPLLYFSIKFGSISNLMPIWNHSLEEIFKSSKASSALYTGFETLLVYFPLIKSPKKNKKWAHFAILFVTFDYTLIVISTVMYFSPGLLGHILYPLIVETKIVEFSFISRIDNIFVFCWLLLYMPLICISIWSCTRIVKRVTNLNPHIPLLFLLILIFMTVVLIDERIKVEELGRMVSEIGFYFNFAFIPLLFMLYLIRSKIRTNN